MVTLLNKQLIKSHGNLKLLEMYQMEFFLSNWTRPTHLINISDRI